MSYDDDNPRSKRISVSEMGGSTSVHVDVLPGDTFAQIAEHVKESAGKTSPVTIFHKNGDPYAPNYPAYDVIEDGDQLLYSVNNTGG